MQPPIPAADELNATEINRVIEESLSDLRDRKISGPQVTPHVLSELEKATAGESVSANLSLAEHNALIAAEIAVQISAQ